MAIRCAGPRERRSGSGLRLCTIIGAGLYVLVGKVMGAVGRTRRSRFLSRGS
jgi:hypothetical protein